MGATSIKESDVVSSVRVKEQLSSGTLSDKYVTHEIKDQVQWNASSSPDAETIYSGSITIADSEHDMDLKALTNTEGTTIVTEAKKVRVFKVKNRVGNSVITISEHVTNGYPLLGASFTFQIEAGDSCLFILNDNAPAIGNTDLGIQFVGTTDDIIDVIIIFG